MVSQLDRMSLCLVLTGRPSTLVDFLTSRYLVLIPLGREHASTLRIKVGPVRRATPVGESATRVVIDVCVAYKIWLAV